RYQELVIECPKLQAEVGSLSFCTSLKYLGVTPSESNIRRSQAIFFLGCLITTMLILNFITARILPHWTYCYPVIFPDLSHEEHRYLINFIAPVTSSCIWIQCTEPPGSHLFNYFVSL
ncbi:unnamed protein product, partial [Dicrocoelium dendriticum]